MFKFDPTFWWGKLNAANRTNIGISNTEVHSLAPSLTLIIPSIVQSLAELGLLKLSKLNAILEPTLLLLGHVKRFLLLGQLLLHPRNVRGQRRALLRGALQPLLGAGHIVGDRSEGRLGPPPPPCDDVLT